MPTATKLIPTEQGNSGFKVATDEEIAEILATADLKELEGTLQPVFPSGVPYLIVKDKYIPYEKGKILIQELKVRLETDKLAKMKGEEEEEETSEDSE